MTGQGYLSDFRDFFRCTILRENQKLGRAFKIAMISLENKEYRCGLFTGSSG